MRRFWIFLTLVFPVLLFASGVNGQELPPTSPQASATSPTATQPGALASARGDGDWNRVQQLVNGQEIIVSTGGKNKTHCRFSGATTNFLFCEPVYGGQNGDEYKFERAEVETIRQDQWHRNAKLAIGTSAAAGFVWGAVRGSDPRSGYDYPRVVTGLAGGLVGALAGCVVALPVAFLVPGHLVYRQPKWERRAHLASGLPRESVPAPPRGSR